eukprot:SAG31_NODE_8428_length_1454_cov_1.433948_1_plen_59_part_00
MTGTAFRTDWTPNLRLGTRAKFKRANRKLGMYTAVQGVGKAAPPEGRATNLVCPMVLN